MDTLPFRFRRKKAASDWVPKHMDHVVDAKRIEIEYEDGSVEIAEGEAAKAIMRWYRACEVMNCVHGAAYNGPHFQVKKLPDSK